MKRRASRSRRAMIALRWLNAAFLVLAACRALVPGLCMTQLAARDAMARNEALPLCCRAHEACETTDAPTLRVPPVDRGPCAFCTLIQGMLDPLEPALLALPYLAEACPSLPLAVYLPRDVANTRQGRAPPVIV